MSSRGSLRSSIFGFTMVELLVVLAVMAIIASIAAPSIIRQMANRRIRNAAAELQSSILQARSLTAVASRPVEMWPAYNSSWNVPTANRGSSISLPNPSDVSAGSLIAAKLSWYVVTPGFTTGTGTATIASSTANNYPIQVSLPSQTVITVKTVPVTLPDATAGIRFFPAGWIGNITPSGTLSTPFTQLTFTICDSALVGAGDSGYTVIVSQSGSVRTAGGAIC